MHMDLRARVHRELICDAFANSALPDKTLKILPVRHGGIGVCSALASSHVYEKLNIKYIVSTVQGDAIILGIPYVLLR